MKQWGCILISMDNSQLEKALELASSEITDTQIQIDNLKSVRSSFWPSGVTLQQLEEKCCKSRELWLNINDELNSRKEVVS